MVLPDEIAAYADTISDWAKEEPAVRALEAPTVRRLESPRETKGWNGFTIYVGSDPEYNIPGVRVDGFTDPDGVRWVRARGGETPEIIVTVTSLPAGCEFGLVRYEDSQNIKSTQTRQRRAARAQRVRRG